MIRFLLACAILLLSHLTHASWGGSLGVAHRQYFQSPNSDVNSQLEIITLNIDGKEKLGETTRFKYSLEGEAQPNNKSTSEQSFGNPREAYLEQRISGSVLQFGYNTFSWGVTDVANPLDVLNPRRYQDILDSEKIGVPSFSARIPFWGSFDFVYIPVQTKTLLPGDNSRWLPRDQLRVSGTGNYAISIPDANPSYHYESDQVWDSALNNNLGMRWQGQLSSTEFSLVGFEGAGQTPVIVPQATTKVVSVSPQILIALDPHIGLQPNFYRERLVGGSIVQSWRTWIFRLTSSYWDVTAKHPDIPGWPGWNQENVAAIERTWSIRSWSLTGLMQATYNRRQDDASDSLTSISRLLDRAILAGFRFSNNENIQTLFLLGYDTHGQGELATLFASYGFSDFWKASLQGDVITGPSGSALGSYAQNSRATLRLTRSW